MRVTTLTSQCPRPSPALLVESCADRGAWHHTLAVADRDTYLFLTKRFYRLQQSRTARWIETGRYSSNRQCCNCERGRCGHEFWRIETWRGWEGTERGHQSGRPSHPQSSTKQCQKGALDKKLEHDAAICCTNRFAQPDFASSVGYRDQHNIDYSNCSERERNQSDAS